MNHNKYLAPITLGCAILVILLAIVTMVFLWYNRKARENLLHAILHEREKTMNEVGGILHDNLSQLISFALMNIRTALATDKDPRSYLDVSEKLMAEVLHDLKNLGNTLSSQHIKSYGLMEVLNKLMQSLGKMTGIKLSLDIEGTYRRLDEKQEILIYRIAQEAIHNIVKHAQASNIYIQFSYLPESVTMSIKDDGIGISSAVVNDSPGMGITNMKYRAKLLNGELFIIPNTDAGTIVALKSRL